MPITRSFAAALIVLLVALTALPVAAPLQAQSSDNSTAEGGGAAGETSSSFLSVDAYPPNPKPFYRGNRPPSARGPGAFGFYLNLWSFAFVLVMFALWTWSSNWVYEDSRTLKLRSEFWCSVMLVCGVVGLLTVLCIPSFFFGFVSLLVFYGIPLGVYIKERNDRVPGSSKVMTPDHLQKVLGRQLVRIGIRIPSRKPEESLIGPPVQFLGKSATGLDDNESRTRQVESSKGYMAAKELIYDAILRRSTDIHLEPKDSELAVRLRIDGVMYPAEPFDRATGDSLLNIFKVLCAMDITEKRRPQDGSFRAELEDRAVDFRVATQGTRHGEKMSLRILDQTGSVNSLANLGLRKQLQIKLREVIHQPHGLLLVCGPTGSGKSTSLYAALRDVDSYQSNVITVEDPIEYNIANVNQIEINTKSGQTFATTLRSILRQDPDVVMIGEIRDAETAEIACQAANTGHMVFSTVHANDTVTAVFRLQELGVESFVIANSLSAVLSQRLVRRLCKDCREPYKPERKFIEKAGLPADRIDVFYRPPKQRDEICQTCGGIGFLGRTGVFELLVISNKLRELIRDKASMQKVRAEARKEGMLYMREEALRLLARGITSLSEIQRVIR